MALDFGAESGRTVVGRFDGGQLAIEPVHRYANTPVRMAGTLYWDFPRQLQDIFDGLARAPPWTGRSHRSPVDTWGVDYGFIDARGRLVANPVHYRDTPPRGHGRGRLRDRAARRALHGHGHPVHVHQHALPAAQRGPRRGPRARAGRQAADDAGPLPPLPLRQHGGGVHRREHGPDARPPDPGLGTPALRAPRHPHPLPARDRRAGHGAGAAPRRGRRGHGLARHAGGGRRLA